MKRLLLLIASLFLFSGISIGENFSFLVNPIAWSSGSSTSAGYWLMFKIDWIGNNSINLVWFSWYNYEQDNCVKYTLYKLNQNQFNWTMGKRADKTIIYSWSMQTWWGFTTIDFNITSWVYVLGVSLANWNSCLRSYYNSKWSFLYYSWFFSKICSTASTNDLCLSNTYVLSNVAYLEFSWTDPSINIPNPLTIHYNWITTSFTGTDIYLTDRFHNFVMSGSDIVFQPYVYRALFRSH